MLGGTVAMVVLVAGPPSPYNRRTIATNPSFDGWRARRNRVAFAVAEPRIPDIGFTPPLTKINEGTINELGKRRVNNCAGPARVHGGGAGIHCTVQQTQSKSGFAMTRHGGAPTGARKRLPEWQP